MEVDGFLFIILSLLTALAWVNCFFSVEEELLDSFFGVFISSCSLLDWVIGSEGVLLETPFGGIMGKSRAFFFQLS